MSRSRVYPRVSHSNYRKVAIDQGVGWMKQDYKMTEIVMLDKWDVSGEYPFAITRQSEEVYTEEYKAQLASLTPQEKSMMKMNLNAMYGMGGLGMGGSGISSNYYMTPGGGSLNHPGVSMGYSGLKEQYYGISGAKAYSSATVPHEGTANCIQQERLVSHFRHKVSKTSSKKKNEIDNLNKIIDMHQAEIDIYVDEFPERFI